MYLALYSFCFKTDKAFFFFGRFATAHERTTTRQGWTAVSHYLTLYRALPVEQDTDTTPPRATIHHTRPPYVIPSSA